MTTIGSVIQENNSSPSTPGVGLPRYTWLENVDNNNNISLSYGDLKELLRWMMTF
ncbi:MAG: hypothetical protein WDO15_14105 [Bacteroidota bacterium]